MSRNLRGGCNCGRNAYVIEFPPNATEIAQVFFDSSISHRRSQATPLSAWLRVPLSWFHSTTHAFFNDETHSAIRRVYTSPQEKNSKRHFCGFCGTPLSFWSESPPSEADYISLTLGSLSRNDLEDLEDMGLLPSTRKVSVAGHDSAGSKEELGGQPGHTEVKRTDVGVHEVIGIGSVPWFESMIEGSFLSQIKRNRGARHTEDVRVRVEWEIVEWTDDVAEEDARATGKRKLEAVEGEGPTMSGIN